MDAELQTLLRKAKRRSNLTFDQSLSVLDAIGWNFAVSEEMLSLHSRKGKPEVVSYSGSYERYGSFQKRAVDKLPKVQDAKKRIYVLNLSPLKNERGFPEFSCEEWRKARVALITSPMGSTFRMVDGDYNMGNHPHKFWREANTRADLYRVLGIDPNEEGRRKPKGDQLLGQCPVCDSEQVTHGGKMVLHGYERPGYGWIEGRCFGVDYPAYNLSCEGCIDYGKFLTSLKASRAKHLRSVKDDKVDSFVIKHHRKPDQIVKRGEADFEDARQDAIRGTERTIKQIGAGIKQMADKVTSWKARQLRGISKVA